MSASVLIADDEALIRQSLRSLLTEEGFDVHVAASGAEAWSRFQETRPDVVLLDLVLGDADGLDVLRKMKQEAPDTKVILISAHGSIESAVTAMKLGGYDFIKKPFELEEIVAAVRNAVRTSRLEQRVAYLAAQERRRSGGAAFVHAAPRDDPPARRGGGDRQEPRAAGAGDRRERHRQAGDRAHAARGLAARERPVRRAQLLGDPREPGGERALWPRARRLLRRARAQARAWWRSPTAGRCSSTRSAISALARRPSC